MSDGYSSRNWECPFFQRDDRGRIKCEIGDLHFHDQKDASKFAAKHCASCAGWKDCSLARHLEDWWEENG